MWTIIPGRLRGCDQLPTSTQASSERRWSNSNPQSARDIKLACCRRIVPAQARQTDRTRRLHLHKLPLVKPTRRKWSLPALLPLVPANCLLSGSRDIHQKVVRTLSTTTLAPPLGSIHDDSNILGCTVRMRDRATAPFNSNPYPNWVPFPADGKCGSRTLHVYTLSITTPRRPRGTTRDCRLPWIRTCRSTSVTLGAS